MLLPLSLKLRALQQTAEIGQEEQCLRCGGFTVYDPEGRIGTVGDVRAASSPDHPTMLAVRVGLFRTRIVLIPTTDVDHIFLHDRRVTLKAQHRAADTLGRMVEELSGRVVGAGHVK